MNPEALRHPSILRIERVAKALGDMVAEVVFIGGSIAPLLQSEPPFVASRPTVDVDGVWASKTYSDVGLLHQRLRDQGLRQGSEDVKHIHRWRTQDGDALDLVPTGKHPGGSGQTWDRLAIETSVEATLAGGVVIRHASAPAFLSLKWAAYGDRGVGDPFASHDLEDIIALVAARPSIIGETEAAPTEMRDFVAGQVSALLSHPDLDDLLAGHLNNAQDPARTQERVRARLAGLGGLGPARRPRRRPPG